MHETHIQSFETAKLIKKQNVIMPIIKVYVSS